MTDKPEMMPHCKACGLTFNPVEWLPWRPRGYCSEECDQMEHKPVESRAQGDLL